MTLPPNRLPLTIAILCAALTGPAVGQPDSANDTLVPQGGVARWSGLAAAECGIFGKRYPAVDAVCYYPVDIATEVGRHQVAVWDQDGAEHLGWVKVEKVDFPDVEMELPDDLMQFVEPDAEQQSRHTEERAAVLKVFEGEIGDPLFSLPLAAPTASLPKSEDDFGSIRVFNEKRRSQHTGRDYPVGAGNVVKAVADGKVILAADHFFTGNAVYVDHGAGLVSMNFHLGELAVKDGATVKRGDTLGKIGSTGRSTGPHLHLGLRWLGQRIDPQLLLDSPNRLPAIGESDATASAKIDAADAKEPPETDDTLYDDEG